MFNLLIVCCKLFIRFHQKYLWIKSEKKISKNSLFQKIDLDLKTSSCESFLVWTDAKFALQITIQFGKLKFVPRVISVDTDDTDTRVDATLLHKFTSTHRGEDLWAKIYPHYSSVHITIKILMFSSSNRID